MELDDDFKALLEGVIGVVEATSFERSSIWIMNRDYSKRNWEENLSGRGTVVGKINKRPIFIAVNTAKIDGHKVLFVDATSELVDWAMIDKWLVENLPPTAFKENGWLNKSDAQNWHNVLPYGC